MLDWSSVDHNLEVRIHSWVSEEAASSLARVWTRPEVSLESLRCPYVMQE